MPFGLFVTRHVTSSWVVVGVVAALEAHPVAGDVSVTYVVITASVVFATSRSVEASAWLLLFAALSSSARLHTSSAPWPLGGLGFWLLRHSV